MKPIQFSLRTLVLAAIVFGILSFIGIEIYDRSGEQTRAVVGVKSRTDTDIISERGTPNSKHEYQLSDARDILRSQLQHCIPNPESNTTIRELRWERGRWSTIIWFTRVDGVWRAFQSIEFSEDVVF